MRWTNIAGVAITTVIEEIVFIDNRHLPPVVLQVEGGTKSYYSTTDYNRFTQSKNLRVKSKKTGPQTLRRPCGVAKLFTDVTICHQLEQFHGDSGS